MLATMLDYLVVEGLLERHVFGSVPPKVDYALTPIARSFLREISYEVEGGNCISRRYWQREIAQRMLPATKKSPEGKREAPFGGFAYL